MRDWLAGLAGSQMLFGSCVNDSLLPQFGTDTCPVQITITRRRHSARAPHAISTRPRAGHPLGSFCGTESFNAFNGGDTEVDQKRRRAPKPPRPSWARNEEPVGCLFAI